MPEHPSVRTVLLSIPNFHWVIACSDIISTLKHLFCRESPSEPVVAMLSPRILCNDGSVPDLRSMVVTGDHGAHEIWYDA